MMSEQRLRIGFLSALDPKDKRAWSGTFYYTSQALQQHCGEVIYINPKEEQPSEKKAFYKKLRVFVKKKFAFSPLFSIGRKYFVCNYRIFTAKRFAKSANRRLRELPLDIIVAAASTSEIAFVETDIPIVLIEDATFAVLHDYYPQYTNLPRSIAREMNNLSATAINKAEILIYSSTWAAQSAIEDYGAKREKVHVVPMGANIDAAPAPERILSKKDSNRCRLLFIGFDWQRKGGDIAFETLLKLEEMGIPTELIVCGCVPPSSYRHPHMRIIPFLDKNDPAQNQELEQLYLSSHFLLLPTRNDCFGIVFCEANAFGLPVIATATGGTPEVVKNGENGFLLPFAARGDAYAKIIEELFHDEQRYDKLVQSSRAAYDNRLNWDAWGISVSSYISEIVKREVQKERLIS
ncbi:MAG TPA: glycosyltransferase family 4 protein [Ktedonobacteraceae bacterium]|nr:glycosyltransferase family 4 protein [Ktedonobacteraceae bacterium]